MYFDLSGLGGSSPKTAPVADDLSEVVVTSRMLPVPEDIPEITVSGTRIPWYVWGILGLVIGTVVFSTATRR